MPSLEQLRYEELAAQVERAARPQLLQFFGPGYDPLVTRVEMTDGRIIDFRLREVVLDGGLLLGRYKRQLAEIPLSDIQLIWRRRYHRGRTAAVCGATIAVTTAVMAAVTSALASVIVGPLFGLPFGGGIAVLLNQFGLLTQWELLYDKGGAHG